jgi:uncharacterized protein YjbJ (UPF0337 family)
MHEQQVKGTTHSVGGAVEQSIGGMTGAPDMQAKGIVDQVRGNAEQLYGDTKDTVSDVIGRAGPAIRDTADTVSRVTRDNAGLAIIAAGAAGFAIAWALQGNSRTTPQRGY